jgi:hypothetical protein
MTSFYIGKTRTIIFADHVVSITKLLNSINDAKNRWGSIVDDESEWPEKGGIELFVGFK